MRVHRTLVALALNSLLIFLRYNQEPVTKVRLLFAVNPLLFCPTSNYTALFTINNKLIFFYKVKTLKHFAINFIKSFLVLVKFKFTCKVYNDMECLTRNKHNIEIVCDVCDETK